MNLYIQSQFTDELIPSLKSLAIQLIVVQQLKWKGLIGMKIEEEIDYILINSTIIEHPVYTDSFLRTVFEEVITRFTTPEVLNKLKEGGSTQSNKALHNIYTSFAGKRIFWEDHQVLMIHRELLY